MWTLDDLAKKLGKIEVTPLSVETKTNKNKYGTIFIQTIFKDDSLKNVFMKELKNLVNALLEKYSVEISIKEVGK